MELPPRVATTTLLVMAKAPVAGLAKTRLAPAFGDVQAARLAAAALLDTLETLLLTPAHDRIVALAGDLTRAECSTEVQDMLTHFTVIDQRGDGFGERLANAHRDAARIGHGPVVQIGMDTPQLTPELLTTAARLTVPGVATLGPAHDGGWWILGLADPDVAGVLADVPMSTAHTGRLTAEALRSGGLAVRHIEPLGDVDTAADAVEVAAQCRSDARFPAALHAASRLARR